MKTKERVLHARIPEALDDAIRAHAAGLGVSVSNLVRNVLTNAVGVVGAAAGKAATGGKRRPAPRVLGWQEATLELNAVCDRCNAILPRGGRAAISVVDHAIDGRPIRCLSCLEELTRG
ncbi:MAG TPA: hypothetical protein VMZ28_13865 [Kofleriaceae bacterium]|nr:hypothetical protein [Kofleriaceae bacterium]